MARQPGACLVAAGAPSKSRRRAARQRAEHRRAEDRDQHRAQDCDASVKSGRQNRGTPQRPAGVSSGRAGREEISQMPPTVATSPTTNETKPIGTRPEGVRTPSRTSAETPGEPFAFMITKAHSRRNTLHPEIIGRRDEPICGQFDASPEPPLSLVTNREVGCLYLLFDTSASPRPGSKDHVPSAQRARETHDVAPGRRSAAGESRRGL